jgi:hypothetical protein
MESGGKKSFIKLDDNSLKASLNRLSLVLNATYDGKQWEPRTGGHWHNYRFV